MMTTTPASDHDPCIRLHPDPDGASTSGGSPSIEDSVPEASRPIDTDCPSLRIITMPKDTNNYGTVFGGVILSYIDQAGFIEARKHGVHRWVTVAMDKVIFHAPVFVGDTVNFLTGTIRTGKKSVTVQVVVDVERFTTGERVRVTEAQLTFVSVDAEGRAIDFRTAPTAM